jgi:anthranilate synthase component 1
LKPPFDIAGDLDTPVSAFAKLRVPAALPAGERRGRRAPRPLLVHRLRRGAGGAARARRALVAEGAYGVPANQASCCSACARRWRARRGRPPRAPGVPLAGGLVGYASYDVVRWFEKLPRRHAAPRRCAGPALRRAALAAGVRSPDARHRAAARRQRGRAPGAAPRGDRARCAAACRRRTAGAALAGRSLAVAGAVPRRRARTRSTSPRATSTSSCCRCASRAARSRSLPGLSRAAADQPLALHVLLRSSASVTVVGSSPEALVKLQDGQAQLRPIAGTRPRADDGGRGPAREASCSPIRRRTPST